MALTLDEALKQIELEKQTPPPSVQGGGLSLDEALNIIDQEGPQKPPVTPFDPSNIGTLFTNGLLGYAGDFFLGGLGYGMEKLGQLDDWLSGVGQRMRGDAEPVPEAARHNPFDPRAMPAMPDNRGKVKAGDNAFQQLANLYLAGNEDVQAHVNDQYRDVAGENPSVFSSAVHGVGTSAMPLLMQILTMGSMGGAGGLGSVMGALAGGVSEGVAESGGFLTDAYSQGRHKEAVEMTDQIMAANAALNPVMEYVGGLPSPFLNKIPGAVGWLLRRGADMAQEGMIQEPIQEIITRTAQETLDAGGDYKAFWANLFRNIPEQYWETVKEVGPSAALSTLIGGGIGDAAMGALNMRQSAPNVEQEQSAPQTPHKPTLDEALREIEADQAAPNQPPAPEQTAEATPPRMGQRAKVKEGFKRQVLDAKHSQYGEAEAEAGAEIAASMVERLARLSGKDVEDVTRDIGLEVRSDPEGEGISKGDTYQQSLGEKGAASLDAGGDGRRMDNLGVAREMEKSGKDAKAIRMATGWERGADGKWRYEILDGEFSLRGFDKDTLAEYDRLEKRLNETEPGSAEWAQIAEEMHDLRVPNFSRYTEDLRLMNIYNAPELYAAYPDLRMMKVKLVDSSELGDATGQYNPQTDSIALSDAVSEGRMKDALVHEIQHAIQAREGFAKGGNLDSAPIAAGRVYSDLMSKIEELEKQQRELPNAAEIERGYAEDISILDTLPEEDVAAYDAMIDKIAALERKKAKLRGLDTRGVYKALAGETEARNASKRMDMTAEERRNTLLAETEDVSREDQIVLRNTLGAAESSPSRPQGDSPYPYGHRLSEGALANQTKTAAFKEFFGDWENDPKNASKVTYKNGKPKPVYHGTGRADRVGSVFRPDRATSGPMAFFTDSRKIGGNYAKDKQDTSLRYDTDYDTYETQFRVKDEEGTIQISDAWRRISASDRIKIRDAARHVTWSEDMSEIVFDPNAKHGTGGFQDWRLREHKGNAIAALVDEWLNDGNLYDREEDFLEVLKLAGVTDALKRAGLGDVKYMDPNYREEKVYSVYLNIRNPFDATTQVTEEFVKGFEEWFDEQEPHKYDRATANADLWDKNSVSAEAFAERMRNDIENGASRAWTSIPDSMTDYLKSLGYDGIRDAGGKNGGAKHTVYIPFYSEQIKSATDNAGTFDRNDPNIYKQSLGEKGAAENIEAEPDSIKDANTRGYTKFIPEIKDKDGNVIQEARTVIGILEKGDKSTLPHELGHVFLEYMKRIATAETVSKEAAQEWRILQDWLHIRDINFGEPLSEKDAKRWRNAQEKFAAGFERYLTTGRAPNKRLARVFEAFRQWMRDIYGAIRNITYTDADGNEQHVKLSKDVRGLMDRMIGAEETKTETEIAEDWSYPELSGEATDAVDGWLDQWERHGIQDTEWQDAQAISDFIREHGGLRFQDFVRALGKDGAKDIREKWRGLFRNTTGNEALSLDVMTQQLEAAGFKMDDAGLIHWLSDVNNQKPQRPAPLIEMNVDTMNALIDRLGVDGARRYMNERARYLKHLQKELQDTYDMDKNNARARADLEATYKEQREIRENLKALDRVRNAENPDRDMTENERMGLPEGVSDAAEPEVKPKKRKPQETTLTLYEALKRGYQMAERASKEGYRAGKKETETKLRADFKERLEKLRTQGKERAEKRENKLKEFYRNWVERTRKQGQARAEKVQGRLDKLRERLQIKAKKANEKQEIARLVRNIERMAADERVSWRKQQEIRGLLEGYDLKKRSKAQRERQADAEAFLEAYPGHTEGMTKTERRNLGRTTREDMSIDGLRALRETVRKLHDEGRKEFEAWTEAKAKRIDAKRLDLRGALEKRTVEKPQATRGRQDKGKQYKGLTGKMEKLKDWTYANTLGRDRFFDWLDGGRTKHDGAFVKYFVDELNKAYDEGLKHTQKRKDWMEAELKKLGFKIGDFSRTAAEIDGMEYTWDQVMEIYMGMKNEKKAQAVLYGNFVNEGSYTVEEAEEVVKKLLDTLTPEHKKAAELVARDHEMHFDRLNEALIRASNRGMDHETDYTSIHRLEYQSYQGLLDANDEVALMEGMSRGAVFQKVENGFTKRRVEISPEHQGAIQLGLFSNWMSDAARHEHAAAMMGPAGELMSALMRRGEDGKTIGRMVKDRFGNDAWKALTSFFNDSVNDDMRLVHGVLDDMSRTLTRNMAISYLAANPSPVMKQTASLPRFMIAAGLHRMLASTARFLSNHKAFLDRVYELSPQIRDRKGDEMLQAIRQDPEWGKRKYQQALDLASAPIGWMDRAVCAIGWDAVYNANLAALGHDGAIKEANRIVRLTQPITNPKDKSRLWRQGGPMRVVMMFTGDANQTWGMTVYDLAQQLGSKEWNATKKGFLTMVVMTATAGWIKLIGDFFSGAWKDDDDDDEKSFIGEALTEQSLLSVPIIGKELLTAVNIRKGNYKGWQPSSLSAPAVKLVNALWDWDSEDEDKQARALRDGAEALSLLGVAPMPIAGMRRLFRTLSVEE